MEKTGSDGVGKLQIFTYGSSNFANQLSWAMVSSYLTVFYLEVYGLTAGAIAIIMLVARIWDGVNDPIMGNIIDRTDTKFGKYRPYILLGAPALVITTIMTFSVPNLAGTSKILYAFVTYVLLGMSYTIVAVPLQALPAVMTSNRGKVSKLYSAYLFGMFFGMIILNLFTLPLIEFLGGGVAADGYQKTATLYACISLPIYLAVFAICKEKIKSKKKTKAHFFTEFKGVLKNKNLMMVILYTIISMTGYFARLGIAVIYYINVIGNMKLITIFMMFPMAISLILLPFVPKIISKLGLVKTASLAMIFQAISCFMLFFGPIQSVPYVLLSLAIFGLGGIGGPCGSSMIVDSVNDYDARYNKRYEGIAFATNGLGTKIATAFGGALGVLIIGWFGYAQGVEVTNYIRNGISIAALLVPATLFLLSLIPFLFYKITPESIEESLEILAKRNASEDNAEKDLELSN